MQPHHDRATASPTTITVTCRLFGRYAECVGVASVTLTLPSGSSARDAIAALRAQLGNPQQLPEHPLVAVNQQHALPTTSIHDGDELAVLPPLAGG